MSYRVEQEIKGTIYVYEATSYWDKEKKRPGQKRKIIGKRDKVTGELILNESDEPKEELANPICKNYGHIYFLGEIAKAIGLKKALMYAFPENWSEILTCAFYEISERKPLYLCEYWCTLTELNSKINLSSQRISELLPSITDGQQMNFFKKWCSYRLEREYLAFDITSISSYSKLIEFVELGYNRDKENLPQINLAMLFGQESQLPIFYNFYEGSIRDVSTLPNMMKFADELGISKMKYVMDKGFYSDANIKNMLNRNVKFTIAVPFSNNKAKELVDDFREKINSPNNTICIGEDVLYAETSRRKIGTKWIYEHIFFNEKHFIDEKETLYKKLSEQEQAIINNSSHELGKYSKYFTITRTKRTKKIINIEKNLTVIEDSMKYKGYLIIMSNDIKSASETIYVYRTKDVVEKSFDNLKNDLDLKRLRIHSTQALKGRLFISFIALILLSHILKTTKISELNKKFTSEEIIYELKKISIIYFTTSKNALTEITKNQRNIFEKFDIKIPKI